MYKRQNATIMLELEVQCLYYIKVTTKIILLTFFPEFSTAKMHAHAYTRTQSPRHQLKSLVGLLLYVSHFAK